MNRKKVVKEFPDDERSLIAEIVKDGLAIQHRFKPEPSYKATGKGYFRSGTVQEIQEVKRNKKKREKN